jgi:hypothetical protein
MKKLLIILTVLLVVGSSCTDFLSVNEKNPNTASAVPANLILPAALNTTTRMMDQAGTFDFVYRWYGCWSISSGYSQDPNLLQYNLLNTHYQGRWSDAYTALQNYDYIDKNSEAPAQRAFRAIAKIMKAFHYQVLVDCYNNVPYSEALKTDQGILKPKYDDAKTIYEDLVIQLDTAMALIDKIPGTAEDPSFHDIIYGGNMTLWWKFANTLKLRILVNQAAMSGRASYITTALATTPHTPADYIGAGESALANPGYLQSAGKMNPFYERFYKQDGSQQADGLGYFAAGGDACDFMNANSDPRRLYLFAPYSGTLIAGNYYGATLLLNPTVCSKLGTGIIKTYNAASPVFTDFESLFLQAEAVTRGFFTGDTLTLYNTAVTRSVVYLGNTAATATTYLAQLIPNVNFHSSGVNPLKAIITQKWLAMNGINPITIWDDYRRTGYPDFLHFSQDPARLNDSPCIRLLYPQTEIGTNNDNVILQGTINLFTSKIFWMQ